MQSAHVAASTQTTAQSANTATAMQSNYIAAATQTRTQPANTATATQFDYIAAATQTQTQPTNIATVMPSAHTVATTQPAAQTAGINDPKAHEILRKVRKNIITYKTLQIDFSYIEKGKKQNGSLLMSGSKYALTLSDMQILTNGTTLWIYIHKTNEVNIYNYNAENDEFNPLLAIKNYEKKYRAKYIRQEPINGKKYDIIDLLPIDGKGSIYKLRFYIDKEKSEPYKFETYTKGETTNSYTIAAWKPNTPALPASFEFNAKTFPGILENDMR
jgi:outer membrane lipoprotein-sorting protein